MGIVSIGYNIPQATPPSWEHASPTEGKTNFLRGILPQVKGICASTARAVRGSTRNRMGPSEAAKCLTRFKVSVRVLGRILRECSMDAGLA